MVPFTARKPAEEESAAAAVLKALLFLACAGAIEWAIYVPFVAKFGENVSRSLRLLFGDYPGIFVVTSLMSGVALGFLTWAFLAIADGKSFLDLGFRRAGRSQFWNGALICFLPGLVVTVALVAAGKAEVNGSLSRLLPGIFELPFDIFTAILLAAGYAFQKLHRRFGAPVAIAVVAVCGNFYRIAYYWRPHQDSEALTSLTYFVAGSVLVYALIGFAYARTTSVWLAAGVFCGILCSPARGYLIAIKWTNEHWRSLLWNLYRGVPYLICLAACALLVWLWTSRRRDSGSRESRSIFYAASWTIASGLAVLLAGQWALLAGRGRIGYYGPQPKDYLYLALILSVYSIGIFCILLYDAWAAIDDGHARTTPGKAVGLLFVPFFNLFWIFQAIAGFPDDYNKYAARRHLKVRHFGNEISIAYLVLSLASCIPVYGMLATVPAYGFGVAMVIRMSFAIDTLASQKTAMWSRRALLGLGAQTAGQQIAVPLQGVIVGSRPGYAGLVLAVDHVGESHARLWADPRGPGMWVQDLQSGEGTFWSDAAGAPWTPLSERRLLRVGSRLRFGSSAADFEVI